MFKKKINKSHPLYGKKIVITGFRDKSLQQKLANIGVKLTSSVSKNTFMVLVKDIDDDTDKAEKAKARNIPIMTKEQFIETYNL